MANEMSSLLLPLSILVLLLFLWYFHSGCVCAGKNMWNTKKNIRMKCKWKRMRANHTMWRSDKYFHFLYLLFGLYMHLLRACGWPKFQHHIFIFHAFRAKASKNEEKLFSIFSFFFSINFPSNIETMKFSIGIRNIFQ